MTERLSAGATIEERLAAIEDKLWPPPSLIRERDLRIDVYRSGKDSIRITHIPTGIVMSETVKREGSLLQAKAKILEELETRLIESNWSP